MIFGLVCCFIVVLCVCLVPRSYIINFILLWHDIACSVCAEGAVKHRLTDLPTNICFSVCGQDIKIHQWTNVGKINIWVSDYSYIAHALLPFKRWHHRRKPCVCLLLVVKVDIRISVPSSVLVGLIFAEWILI